MKVCCFFLFLGLMFSCSVPKSESQIEQIKNEVEVLLSDWHDAAAQADFNRYFNHMADSSIFIGTDATEYWSKSEFMAYSKPYFDKGKAWTFKASKRRIYIDAVSDFAWFDEELETQNMGPCRGSGVLKKENQVWKIQHYNLTVPIPNALVGQFVKEIETELSKSN